MYTFIYLLHNVLRYRLSAHEITIRGTVRVTNTNAII